MKIYASMNIYKKLLHLRLIHLFIVMVFSSSAFSPIHASEIDDLVVDGELEFQQKCALCHGVDGKGDGPYSFALVFKPADLTQLMVENNGQFPFLEIYLIIDGREIVESHGTRLMPIWGDRYSQETWSVVNPKYAKTLVRGRILELLLYIYSIQEP